MPTDVPTAPTYADDRAFLIQHTELIELSHCGTTDTSRLLVAPAWQGRVMTAGFGDNYPSLGWVHRENVAAGIQPADQREGLAQHIHVFGGAERFWLAPEGGQFSLYFPQGETAFDFSTWAVPAFIDTEPWAVTAQTDDSVTLTADAILTNASGTALSLRVERTVRLLDPGPVYLELRGDVSFDRGKYQIVAYETENTITNTGDTAWTTDTGLPALWMLSMFPPGDRCAVVIPIKPGPVAELGPPVNDDYFGAIVANRLHANTDTGFVLLRADGASRGKIGIPPARALPIAGSWDAFEPFGLLTIQNFTLPDDPTAAQWVNSAWELQDNPFAGDAVNAYNDGPIGDDQLGPFYELESLSPALALAPGESYTHNQRTTHISGLRRDLNPLARRNLHITLDDIEAWLDNSADKP